MQNETIKFETDLEKQIGSDKDLTEGLLWGKPRYGHEEGKVVYHVQDVLTNINDLKLSGVITSKQREDLRIIAIIHDSFKYKVDRSKDKSGENHHAMIARRFAEKYITDTNILDIIELHDDAYNAWCKGDRNGNWDKAEDRATKLYNRLGNNVELYTLFYKCDNTTASKDQECYKWWLNFIENYE